MASFDVSAKAESQSTTFSRQKRTRITCTVSTVWKNINFDIKWSDLDSIFVTSDVDTLEAYIPGFLKTGLAKIPTHST